MASQQKIAGNLSRRQIGWMAPLTVMIGRSVFMILAQGLVALGYAARGHPSPWNAAAHWWTVYATLVDIGCLALMVKFTRVEGIKLRDLIGPIRLRRGRDAVLGLVCFLIYLVSFTFPGLLASKLVFGTTHPSMYPGLLTARNLPLWAVVYSFSLWWIIWSPTEEMTYNGYALPRTQALTGSKLIAVLIVAFWGAIQHSLDRAARRHPNQPPLEIERLVLELRQAHMRPERIAAGHPKQNGRA
jgi:hypothetical protein